MHIEGRHVARLALALSILSVEPCFSQLTFDPRPQNQFFPTIKSSVSSTPSADFKSLLESAEQGDATAQEKVGAAYCDGLDVPQDYHEGLIWLLKAADQNNTRAKSWLGHLYASGSGVPADQAKAFQYFLAAAADGDVSDQLELAERYAQGNGVSPSDFQSLAWYAKAADQGNATAQTQAGLAYYNGKGATKNTEQAFNYFLQASYNDASRAQYYLAYFYWNGIFVQRDPVQAYKWAELAARHDHDESTNALVQEIAGSLTQTQMNQGEALVDNWPEERSGHNLSPSFHATFKSGASAVVPFENTGGQIVIPVTINGHDNLKFMMDTGAATSAVDGISVSQYNIPRSSSYHSFGGIGKDRYLGNRTADVSLSLPGLTFDHVALDICAGLPHVDGFLGFDILRNYVIKIDYVRKTVEFVAPQSFNAADAGQSIPCTISHSKLYVTATIKNNAADSDAEEFVMDTGCYDGFVLSKHFALSYPLLAFTTGIESESGGIGGNIWQETVPCTAAQLGDVVLKDPQVSLVKADQGIFLHVNGLVGNKIWQNFDVTIDCPDTKVYLKANSQFSGPSGNAPPPPAVEASGPD